MKKKIINPESEELQVEETNQDAPKKTGGVNVLNQKAKKSMVTRLISAAVALILCVPALFLGDWFFFSLITFALAVACWEILGCVHKRTWLIFVIYFSIVALIAYWPLFKGVIVDKGIITNNKPDSYFYSIYLSVLVVVICIFVLFFFSVVYKDFTVHDAAFLIAMAVLIGMGFQCLFFLRYYPISAFQIPETEVFKFDLENTFKSSLLLSFVCLSTFVTDAGAYFVGVFFGKNKMNERISPKKTWEGFVGGVVISFIVTYSAAMAFAGCNYPILPFLDFEHWYYILTLSLLIPLFATLGDFVFSSIKRYWGIKDYGKIMPGHGGILDRLDSIFFASIVTAIIVFMVSKSPTGTEDINWSEFLV